VDPNLPLVVLLDTPLATSKWTVIIY